MQNIVLTISLLVSNRIDTIQKCMESIRPILEQIPSELIAIDTVGEKTDGSIDIVREYTDKVYPFAWCNDFSAARNEGLRRAKGEWFMFIDDDEWFEDVSEIIAFFKTGEYKKYRCATYKIHDYSNRQGAYTVGTLNRMIKLEKDTKFCGSVHEYLAPLYLPCKELSSYIHHYGYVFDTQEDHEKHSERNLSLLRPEFEKNPSDMRLRLQMVQECMYLKKLEPEALSLCEDTMRMGEEVWSNSAFQWIIVAYVRLADRNKDWEGVLERAENIRSSFLINSYCNVALCVMELGACKQLEKTDMAEELLQNLEQAYLFLSTNREKRLEQSVLDFDVFLEPSILSKAYENGICLLHETGKKEMAAVWTSKRREFTKQPCLSVSLLVSNNIGTIKKCMESLKPLQQQIGAEVIVVDTVGERNTDGSLKVAKQYANKVVHFEWCDDFSAARNAGLEQAKGEWFLFLDDDEWFDDVQEIIEFFCTGEYLNYNSATYQIRNYKDMEGKSYSSAVLARMLRRRKNTRFVGSVHETFNEIMLPCKEFSSFVHHYGYVYQSENEKKAHLDRNMVLLRKELEKNPLDLRCRSQMALELATYDNEGALAFCEETFRLCANQKKENGFQWQMSLVFRLYEALGTEAAVADETYDHMKKTLGFAETTENAIAYQMVRIHLLKNTPEQAYPYAVKYFNTYQFLKKHSEIQQLQMTADFHRYQTMQTYQEMLHFGGFSACQAGAYQDAWEWYEQLPWEQNGFCNEEAWRIILDLCNTCPDERKILNILKRIMKNPAMIQIGWVKRSVSEVLDGLKNGRFKTAGPSYIKSEIKLTIGVLVSNSMDTIQKCMESLTPIRNAVKSELIVVDTKGEETDGSFAIASQYADKTYFFPWCNDFAAARNVCIDHAEGEWFLFVDDDEWFEDVSEIVEFFQNEECNHYGQALYNIRNLTDTSGNYVDTIVGRFIHRTPETRFVGKIHERFNEVHTPNKLFKTLAYHSGYCYKSEEEKKQHQNRNVSLLKELIKEEGYTPRNCAQMVQEYFITRETWDEGYRFCLECLPVLIDEKKLMKDSCTQWLITASARYFEMKGDQENFWTRVKYIKENYNLSQMAELFITGLELQMSIEGNDLDGCEAGAKKYVQLWDWLKEHQDKAIEQNQLDFGTYYNENAYFRIVHIGAKCANEQKKYQVANTYWKRLPLDRKGFDKFVYWNDMQKTMEGLKELKRKTISPEMQKLVEQLKQNIKVLLDSGNCAAAKELLQGLLEIVPEDEEALQWKKELE